MKNSTSKSQSSDAVALVVLVAAVALCPSPASGGAVLVYNNDDNGAGSLRQAIDDTNRGLGDAILFSNIVSGTITLLSGQLLVTNSVTIIGPGDKVLSVTGNNSSRVFEIANNAAVSISGLTIANGNPPLVAANYGRDGGAILQDSGTLILSGCTISSNRVSFVYNGLSPSGGGVFQNSGTLTATNCTFAGNVANGAGGAVFQNGGTLTLAACTLAGNVCSNLFSGGAVLAFGSAANLDSCTFFGNQAGFGAAVHVFNGNLSVTNCTVSGNFAARSGGGICVSEFVPSPTVHNSIIAGNSSASTGQDCCGSFISAGFNLIGIANDSSGWGGTGDQVGSSNAPLKALLGPLQDNGGLTLTMALLPGSPAIDQGNSGAKTIDQRGAPRAFDFTTIPNALNGDGSDIGAFELGSPRLSIQQLATNVVICWPAYYGGSTLQSVVDLAESNDWSTVTGTPVVVGYQFHMTNGAAGGRAFYRLSFP